MIGAFWVGPLWLSSYTILRSARGTWTVVNNIILGGGWKCNNQNFVIILKEKVADNFDHYRFFRLIIILNHILGMIWTDNIVVFVPSQEVNNQNYPLAFQGNINNYCYFRRECDIIVNIEKFVNTEEYW